MQLSRRPVPLMVNLIFVTEQAKKYEGKNMKVKRLNKFLNSNPKLHIIDWVKNSAWEKLTVGCQETEITTGF